MSIRSSTNSAHASRAYVMGGWFPGGFVDQFIRKLPFQKVAASDTAGPGEAAQNRSTSAVALLRIGDSDETDASEPRVTRPKASDQDELQAKKVAIIRQLGARVFADTTAEFEGLDSKVTSRQTLSISTPSRDDLRRLVYRVTASDGFVGSGPDCLVANERVVRYIIGLTEGVGLMFIRDSDLGTSVPLFNGVPLYIGQVPTTKNLTSIWALKLAGPAGVRVLHTGGKSSEFGIEVRGTVVSGCYGLLIPEAESIAKLQDINVTTIPA